MNAARVNYDALAPTYHSRYNENALEGIGRALRDLTRQVEARRVLEVGCGTGHWLAELQPYVDHVDAVLGLDASAGMLKQAQARSRAYALVRGRADRLPFPEASFDLVLCVNALHHFDHRAGFIHEARRLLRPGGVLVVIGMDPHNNRDTYYLYDYFDGVQALDLQRYPSAGEVLAWMIAAGLERIEWRIVERIVDQIEGRAMLDHYFLRKESSSQLALLSDEAYAIGVQRIRAAIEAAEVNGETITFRADIGMTMLTGWAPREPGR